MKVVLIAGILTVLICSCLLGRYGFQLHIFMLLCSGLSGIVVSLNIKQYFVDNEQLPEKLEEKG